MKKQSGSHNLHGILFVLLGLTTVAAGQQSTNNLMAGMATNARQLQQYTFKQRIETYRKGELKDAKINEVHYNTSGERVVIPIDEEKTESTRRLRGPAAMLPASRLMAKKMEAKQDEIKAYLDRLTFLASRYLSPEPARFQAAVAAGGVTMNGNSGQVRIVVRNYVKLGDSMTMTLEAATNRPVKTEVTTTLDDDPVSIVLTYDQIRNGPSYPQKTVIRSGAEELEVRTFTFDYRL